MMRFSFWTLFLITFLTACAGPAPVAMVADPSATLTRATLTPKPSLTPIPPPTRRPTITPQFVNTTTPLPSLTPLPLYVFPVQPPSAAAYAEGTRGHGYPATDLFAKVGTKFVAVTSGVVEFVSGSDQWNPDEPDPEARSGLAVAIIGYDGWRYYGSHLSGIAPGIVTGVHVRPGTLLGYIGASGDAVGKTPHLHFGISHPTYPTDWKTRRGEIDPFPYLNWWKKGQNVTPHD